MVKLVNTRDLKSLGFGFAGSSPAARTKTSASLSAVRDLTGAAPQPYRQADYTTCLDLGNFGAVFTTGWDREVQTTGAVAKERKTMINTQWIYPPTGTAEEVFAALRIDARGR